MTVCYCSCENSLAVAVMVDTGGSISFPIYRMVVVLFRYGVLTYQALSQCLKKYTDIHVICIHCISVGWHCNELFVNCTI